MTKQLWKRTAYALGRMLAGMVTLPEDPRQVAEAKRWRDYPRFPAF
jgi:hypothetical protein